MARMDIKGRAKLASFPLEECLSLFGRRENCVSLNGGRRVVIGGPFLFKI